MATDSIRFPLQSAIKKILDDPNSRPALPALDDGSIVGDDNFGKGELYDNGKSPDIALNDRNVVVEVHESQNHNTLWYRVGRVNGSTINWEKNNDKESHEYDKGVLPSVAINDNGLLVEVHKSQGAYNTLWYNIGDVAGNEIKWRNEKTKEYDSGIAPSVAINNNGLVVEVHQSQSHDTLWYRVGKVNGDKIDGWDDGEKSIEIEVAKGGINPSVAITDDGLVVMVYQSWSPGGGVDESTPHYLWYRIGRVQSDEIIWVKGDGSKSVLYDDYGLNPSVAITNDGLVVEVHEKSVGTGEQVQRRVWYRGTGKVNNNTIEGWDDKKSSLPYGDGEVPKIACNGRLAVEIHQEGSDKLLYSVLTLPAFRYNWIEVHGKNSYCYYSIESVDRSDEPIATNKTITVDPGAPFLYAILTKSPDSVDFPDYASLKIKAPDGSIYNHEQNDDRIFVEMWSRGPSLRSLVIRNPQPGDYQVALTMPSGLNFYFEMATVPSQDVGKTIQDTIQNSQSVRKRGLNNDDLDKRMIGMAASCLLVPTLNLSSRDSVPNNMINQTTDGILTTGHLTQVGNDLPITVTPLTLTTATHLLSSMLPTIGPVVPLATSFRVATWNIFHGNLNNVTPLQRIINLFNFGNQHQHAIMAFQEVQRSLINDNQAQQTLNNLINAANSQNGSNYTIVTSDTEYPSNGRAPASTTTDGYLVIYDANVLTLNGGTNFYQEDRFLQGLSQARPPLEFQFTITGTPTNFRFYTWHAEAPRALTNDYPTIMANLLRAQGGHWVIAGDLNVNIGNLPPLLRRRGGELHHYDDGIGSLDHIMSDGTVENESLIPNSDARWDQLFFSDVHYALFARIQF